METANKKNIFGDLKAELDELEEKVKKSGGEFREQYKIKKQKIAALIKKYAHEIEQTGEEKVDELKESSQELLDLLEADYDLSYTEFETESHKISKALDDYEARAKVFFAHLSKEAKRTTGKIEEEMKENLDKFRTEMDIQKAHFKGTADRMKSEYEEWKVNRLKDIASLKKQLDQRKDQAEDKLEAFSGELSESFDHLKKALKKLW